MLSTNDSSFLEVAAVNEVNKTTSHLLKINAYLLKLQQLVTEDNKTAYMCSLQSTIAKVMLSTNHSPYLEVVVVSED